MTRFSKNTEPIFENEGVVFGRNREWFTEKYNDFMYSEFGMLTKRSSLKSFISEGIPVRLSFVVENRINSVSECSKSKESLEWIPDFSKYR